MTGETSKKMKLKILELWGKFVATHPWWVIIGLIVLTIFAGFSAQHLKITTRWSDLLPVHDPMVKEFNHIIQEYTSASNTIIVVQGEETQIKQFCEEIVPQIKVLTQYVERVDYKVDEDFIHNHGFMLMRTQDLEKSVAIFEDLNLTPLLAHINDNFEAVYSGEEGLSTKEKEDNAVLYLDGLQFWIQTMDKFISQPHDVNQALADSAVNRFLIGEPYFISYDKRTLLIMVKPTFSILNTEKAVASTDSIQNMLNRTLPKFPEVKAGLTGTIPLCRDELVYSTNDMKFTSVIALILVLLLFILTFRMWSAPLLAVINLIVAITIAAGISAIFLKSLNLMTSMFIVIIIGLGIDYSIHIISLYSERRARDGLVTAIEQTLARSGSGIITGGLTTAAAFFALMISQTRGIKEMGLILGIGILCAMLTTLIGLPAFLVARERITERIRHRPPRPVNVEFRILGEFGKIMTRRPALFLIIGIGLTAFFMYQTLHVKFDYNYLNMEPKGIASVVLQDTMINAFDLSPDFAMVTATSIEESWEIAEQAKKTPSVSMVEDISDYLPVKTQQTERLPYLEKIRAYLQTNTRKISMSKKNLSDVISQLERLEMNVYELSQLAYIGGQDKVDLKCQQIIGNPDDTSSHSMINQLIENLKQNQEHATRQLNLFQDYYEPILRKMAYAMANPEFITLNRLPESIKKRFLNKDGDKYLVTVFPKKQVWDFEFLRRFTEQMQRISPKITGSPLMFLRLIDYTGRDGLRATLLTLIVVFVLLLIDFRSLGFALLAMIPLIAGGFWMVGLLKTCGLMFTFVNVMGIPMIVGIGIDDGVHLLHRYRLEGLHKTSEVLKSTGKAILLTSLTTMVGFGSLLPAKYRGFTSLGALLVFGVGACFLTTVIILPSIIALIQRRNKKQT
jgi:hopanoid biosynthesis associated RND transporter like protein HpnN